MQAENSCPKVSIIVPVYKAEKYIERCARSLFEQTLDDIEYIFVNDCTPDASMLVLNNVLDEYPHRKEFVRIINMSVNSKQAKVRSVGVNAAKGEYVIHCDPDDWVDLNYYESLYSEAKTKDLDIVVGNYMIHSKDEVIIASQDLSIYVEPIDILKSPHFTFLALWSYMVRKALIVENEIDFYDGIDFMEDYGFLARALFHANNFEFLHSIFYHYEKGNSEAITRRINSLEIVDQRIKCLTLLNDFFESHGIPNETLCLSMRTKRDIKDLFLLSDSLGKWCMLFPEVAFWEYRYGKGSLLYRLAYLLSHKIGTWPMSIILYFNNKRRK